MGFSRIVSWLNIIGISWISTKQTNNMVYIYIWYHGISQSISWYHIILWYHGYLTNNMIPWKNTPMPSCAG